MVDSCLVFVRLENGFLKTCEGPAFEGVFGLVKLGVADRVNLELADFFKRLLLSFGRSSTDF